MLDALSEGQEQLRTAIEGFRAQIPVAVWESTELQWKTLWPSLTGLAAAMKQLEDGLNDIRRLEIGAATPQFQNDEIDNLKLKIPQCDK